MQNMQPTETTTTTTTERTTLADMLALRAEELAEQERVREISEQIAREKQRANALADADRFLQESVSQQLAAILHIAPAVDDNALDTDDEHGPRPGYLMLDMRGAGIDDGDAAASDPNREDRWSLRYEYIHYHGWEWTLHGPQGYAVTMPRRYSYQDLIDAAILDAIGAYPAWLAGADERAEQERQKAAKKQAEQERKRQSRSVPHFDTIDGYGSPGILYPERHLLVLTRDPREEDGMMERRGVLETFSEQWLLLNLDGHERGTLGAQRLIPIANVVEIQPLPDVQEKQELEGDAPTAS